MMLLLLLLSGSLVYGQLHVDEDSDIGIGIEDTGDSRTYIKNETNSKTLELYSKNSSLFDKYGVVNYIEDSDVNSGKHLYGFHSTLTNQGTGNSYGASVRITEEGTGVKSGLYVRVDESSNGVGTNTGIESYMEPSSGSTSYGIKSYMGVKSSSNGLVFGVHTVVANAGSGTKYALHAQGQGTNNHAAIFIGDVVHVGTVWPASDRKLKKEIRDMERGNLNSLCQLQPRRYKMKKSRLHVGSKKEEYGLIAQEVEEHFPNLVKTITIPASEEGDAEEQIKTINYTALIPILIQGMKEQQEEIASLRSRLKNLEEK